jgi:hypothetical protein
LRTLLFLAACLFSVAAPVDATAQSAPREYQIKAVFLFNFLQFVEWPAEAFDDARAPIRIGVLGDDPFGPALNAAVRGETINGRELIVERSQRIEDLRGCQLVFISQSESHRLDNLLSLLGTQPVLTVSEANGFARRGGIIGFYSDGNKVRFEINADAGRQRGLKLSSELLRLGKIVGADPREGGA